MNEKLILGHLKKRKFHIKKPVKNHIKNHKSVCFNFQQAKFTNKRMEKLPAEIHLLISKAKFLINQLHSSDSVEKQLVEDRLKEIADEMEEKIQQMMKMDSLASSDKEKMHKYQKELNHVKAYYNQKKSLYYNKM